MLNPNTQISRRVRIRFKKQAEMIEGYLIFAGKQENVWLERNYFTFFAFMLDDETKTEKMFKTTDVERIDYLG